MTMWLTINSIAIALVCGILFLVMRQLGYVLQRWGPVGARGTPEGPRIGENIAAHFPPAGSHSAKSNLLVFLSESCGVCGAVREGAEELARVWNREADIFLIYDCLPDQQSTEMRVISSGLFLKRDCALRQALGATFVPFAVSTSSTGVVSAKGLVNEVSHLESLLEAEKAERMKSTLGERIGAPNSPPVGAMVESVNISRTTATN
jgi:hypothetical protein